MRIPIPTNFVSQGSVQWMLIAIAVSFAVYSS